MRILAGIILFVSAGVGLLSAQEVSFKAPVFYRVGEDPERVAIADLNGDGIPDLAVTNSAVNTISIFLGRGDGTFVAASDASALEPTFITVADLNGDGIPDLVASPGFNPMITLLFGKGDGTFKPPVYLSAGINPSGVAVGDLSGSGRQDIVVANGLLNGGTTVGYITILRNNGDGTFQPPEYINVGNEPLGVAIERFDAGALPGIAVSNQGLQNGGHLEDGSIGVLPNLGKGVLGRPKYYPAGAYLENMVVSDFNGDGKLDIAVVDSAIGDIPSSVAILLGNGDGSFQPPLHFDAGTFPLVVAAADFNGDGKVDLAVSAGPKAFSILLGNGNGTFEKALFFGSGPSEADAVSTGDLNGDGKPDVVAVFFETGEIGIYLNTTP